jgi:T5SS/PEP-CTERM-associated repeat protein
MRRHRPTRSNLARAARCVATLAVVLLPAAARAQVTISSAGANVAAGATDFFALPAAQDFTGTNVPFSSFTHTATALLHGHAGVVLTATANQDTQVTNDGNSLTITSTGELAIDHRAPDSADRKNLRSSAGSQFIVNFCVTTRSTFRISASGNLEAPLTSFTFGNQGPQLFAGDSFQSVTSPGGGLRLLGGIGVIGATSPSGADADAGTLQPGCYEVEEFSTMGLISPLACKPGPSAICMPPDTPPNNPSHAHGSYRFEFDLVAAGPDGDVFRWIGPAHGGFGLDANWDPTGVPTFVTDTRSDTALFQHVRGAQVDVNALGNLAARVAPAACAGPITRTLGRLVLDGANDVELLDGALGLDGISFANPSLTLQNQGLLELNNATICGLDAVIGATGHRSLAFVRGPGGVLQTLERLSIGADGEGTLTVQDGGIAKSEEVLIGSGNARGTADVSNATWDTGDIAVGFHSPGELTVENAGLVESEEAHVQFGLPFPPFERLGPDASAPCLGRADGSGVEVRGALSKWTVHDLVIGAGGCVDIRNGGLVDVQQIVPGFGLATIATAPGGDASIEVANGRLSVATDLIVGEAGRGHLEVTDHDGGNASVAVAGTLRVGDATGADRGDGDVVVRGDVFTTQDLLVSNALEVPGNARALAQVTIGPRGQVRTATEAHVGTNDGIGIVTITGDPQDTHPELFTRWNIGGALEIGMDGGSSTAIVDVTNATINVGSPSTGQVKVHNSGILRGLGGNLNVVRTNGGSILNDGVIIGPIVLDGLYDPASTGVVRQQLSVPPPPPGPAPPRAPLAFPGGTWPADTLGAAIGFAKTPPPPAAQGPVTITGDADLGGTTLELQFLNGFAPHQGDAFPVVSVGGQLTNGFGAVHVLGLAPGATFDVDAQTGMATSMTDAVALPVVGIKTKSTLKESQKGGLKVQFTRTGPTTAPLTVHYRVRGDAENGVDYATLPGTIDILVKKKAATLVIRPLVDGLFEPAETITLEVLPGDDYAPAIASTSTIILVSSEKRPKSKKP